MTTIQMTIYGTRRFAALLFSSILAQSCSNGLKGSYAGKPTEVDWYSELEQATTNCDISLRELGAEITGTADDQVISDTRNPSLTQSVVEQCETASKFFLDRKLPTEWGPAVEANARAMLDVCADAYLGKVRLGSSVQDVARHGTFLG